MTRYCKFMLLLCALIVGSGSVWGTDVTYTFSDLASANNWSNGTAYTSVVISPITLSAAGGGNNGKYYTSDNSWRMYNGGTVNISAANGYNITAVSSTPSKTFTISNGQASLSCSETIKFTAITVTYSAATPAHTIEAESNNTNYGTVSLNGSVITGAPESGYRYASPAYTVDPANSATIVQNGNEFTVTPSANTTVTINFEAIPTHTATFSVNGVASSQTYAEGASITFPSNPADISGKKFIGWYTSSYTHASTAPSPLVTSATMGNANITYYAVFADVTTGSPVTDELTTSTFGSPSSYKSWSNKTKTSSAKYAGESSGGSSYIQLRATSPSGIVSTASGGKAAKVTVTWDSSTADDRTLEIYGKSSAYSTASDLYDDDSKGTLLGSIYHGVTIEQVKTTTTELTIDGNYQFIGLRSKSGAMYLDEIDIQWTPVTISNYCTTIVFAVTYDGNGATSGSVPEDDNEYSDGDEVTVLGNTGNLVKTDYIFSGWNTQANGEGDDYAEDETFDITDNTTLYAKWIEKSSSDLAITSSSPVALEITSSNLSPTSTITWTTSSEGTMSFFSDKTSVATVSSAGVITAVGEGTAKITISQVADASYKASGNLEVTVNVTDGRSACATGIDLTSAKTITKEDVDNLAATCTLADGFTGSVTYSYVSNNSDIFYIAGTEYMGAGVGATSVTITATPTGGNASNYKPASQVVAVKVNGTNSISLDPTSKTVAYSTSTFDIAATIPTDNYNGTVSAVSNNTSVAMVSVDGTTITVTPHAVGTAKITVTAGTDTYYPVAASAECNVEFTAPEGSTTAPNSAVVVFEETFAGCDGTGANDDNGWSGSIASGDFVDGTSTDNEGWTVSNAKEASACAKFGTGSASGSAKTPELTLEDGVVYTLSFKAGAWNGNSEGTSLSVSAENATIKNEANTATVSSVTTSKGQWTSYTLKLIVTDDSDPVTITFSTDGGNKRFFLDDVKVFYEQYPTVTLNKYGYATYCSVYPIDFTSTEGYTAWRVNSVSGETITFTKITEKIKGGQGVLLYNKNADGVNTSTATIKFADGTTEFDASENKLVGCLAKTYLSEPATSTKYGLVGNQFQRLDNYTGYFLANRAYLDLEGVELAPSAFRIVFEENNATSLESIGESEQAVKFFENGQLFIRRAGKVYDVTGRLVK